LSCEACGVPLGISRGNVWYEDGTISGISPPYVKGTFFDVDELNYLFNSLSEYLGFDISEIVAGGKYHDTKQYMTAMIERMRESVDISSMPLEELHGIMLSPACIWGIAQAEVLSIESAVINARVRHPYSIPLLRGDMAGVTDVLTGKEHRAEWDGDEEEGIMTVFPAKAYSSTSKRLEERDKYGGIPEAAELACERCDVCGAPAALGRIFSWDDEICRIEEKATGRRYCFNNTNGVTAVLKMLIGELEEGLEQRMVDTAREYARALYGGVPGGVELESELESYPYRGWGRVAGLSRSGEDLAIRVENPFNDILIAGRIMGLAEQCEGRSLCFAARAVTGNILNIALKPA
jgi:hypothetical protein